MKLILSNITLIFYFTLLTACGGGGSTTATGKATTTDGRNDALLLSSIGASNPIKENITASNTTNWVRFEAVAGTTYTIELFDVDNSLSINSGAVQCDNLIHAGLTLQVFDDSGSVSPIAAQCSPYGSGNVHNLLEYKAESGGTNYIKISAAASNSGYYSLRILPDYHDSAAEWDSDLEPNNTRSTAYELTPGAKNAVTTSIVSKTISYSTNNADIDWYRFSAISDTTYTIELFNADASLSINLGSVTCDNLVHKGLILQVFDDSGNELPIASQCTPFGSGNVHNLLEFTAKTSSTYFIRVTVNAADSGHYSIRVLPDFNDPAASWDASLEPNNSRSTAYELTPGADNATSTSIMAKNSAYSTNNADIDWYRFQATASTTYTIELFNADYSLGINLGAVECDTFVHKGVTLQVFDDSGNELPIASQCTPFGSGNVHNLLEFTAKTSSTYFIRVTVNAADSGYYSIRVLPDFNDTAASWDSNFEPNNTRSTAYEMSPGVANAITSDIAAKDSSYTTNNADIDWYRFKAVAGTLYTIELYNVDASLNNNLGSGLCDNQVHKGLALQVFDNSGSSSAIVSACDPNGITPVYSSVSFTASYSSNYFIRVSVNPNDSGIYSLRISP